MDEATFKAQVNQLLLELTENGESKNAYISRSF